MGYGVNIGAEGGHDFFRQNIFQVTRVLNYTQYRLFEKKIVADLGRRRVKLT